MQDVTEMYLSGMSIPDIHKDTGIPLSTIRFRLKKAGVLRSRGEGIRMAAEQGKLSQNLGTTREFTDEWKENISKGRLAWGEENARGVRVNTRGYIEYTRGPHKGRSVHTVKMEQRLGRPLAEDECVHHIDENKQNNDDDNLALMTQRGHSRHHQMMFVLRNLKRERNEDGTWR